MDPRTVVSRPTVVVPDRRMAADAKPEVRPRRDKESKILFIFMGVGVSNVGGRE
jgi:hypothetical protein